MMNYLLKDAISLLQSQTRCLERFLALSADFLGRSGAESINELSLFESRRDATLKALDLYERKLEEVLLELGPDGRTQELAAAAADAHLRREHLLKLIREADSDIIRRIEEASRTISEDLTTVRKSKELLGKFKSTWVPKAGEGLDQKL